MGDGDPVWIRLAARPLPVEVTPVRDVWGLQPQRDAEIRGRAAQHAESRMLALHMLVPVEMCRSDSRQPHELVELAGDLGSDCVPVTLVHHDIALDPLAGDVLPLAEV